MVKTSARASVRRPSTLIAGVSPLTAALIATTQSSSSSPGSNRTKNSSSKSPASIAAMYANRPVQWKYSQTWEAQNPRTLRPSFKV